jgi:lactate racemase
MTQTIRTVWNAWEEEPLALDVPDHWRVREIGLPRASGLTGERIQALLEGAFEEPNWRACLAGARSVAILFDDSTRPVCWEPVLLPLLALLEKAGKGRECIRLLASLAGHAPMTRQELEWKLGATIARQYPVVQHSLEGPFEWLEVNGQRVGLHRDYVTADCRIALGSLIPHPFAGFSGGGKAVMPGIADRETIRRNHAMVTFGRGKTADPENGIRNQIESIVAASGLHLLVNAVVNEHREIAALFAGEPSRTFREGVSMARAFCATPPDGNSNIIVLNAYPKDRELLQVSNAFNVLRTLPSELLPGIAAVVLIARAATGLGYHALFGPGEPLWRKPAPLSMLKHAPVLVFAPGAFTQAEFDSALHGALFREWEQVVRSLENLALPRYELSFYHQASLQTAEVR